MALTVLLPENPYSRELLALLGPLLPPDSRIRPPLPRPHPRTRR